MPFPIVRVVLWFTVIGACLLTAFSSHSEEVPEGYTTGQPWLGRVGVQEQTQEIMKRQTQQPKPKKRTYRVHSIGKVELVEYAEESVASSPAAEVSGPIPATAANSQGVAFSFLGANLADTLAYPPDSMGSVGPSQYIVAVNGRIRSFNKSSGVADGILNMDTDVFFQSAMTPPTTNNFTSDPRIRYDRLSQRWFVVMIDVPGKSGVSPNRIMIAVSDGPVISGGSIWTFYYFRQDVPPPNDDSGKFADYPTLGIDANALYIGVNIFKTRGQGSFDNTTAFVVRKSSLLVTNNAPTNIVVTAFRSLVGNGMNPGPYTPQGVDNYDPAASEGYVVGAAATGTFLYFDRLILRRITNSGSTPMISGNITVTIPTTGGTIGVPALGTSASPGQLDGLDYRLLGAHYRNGKLWTSSNLAVDNTGSPSGTDTRMGVRWYELQGIPTGQSPSVAQSGTLFDSTANARCYWMGSIMVSGQGHAAMGFSVAGANDRVNAGTAGRLKNDAAGTVRSPILYTDTSASYNPTDANGFLIERWGDYSYTCLDPDDDMTMWTIQEFCNSNNSYGVQIAKLIAPLPATPLSCNPSVITQGMTGVNVTLIGISDGDTGFFDPGAGFSNRIAAAIGGSGVTVNNVVYNNPTNLTLNLTVAPTATTNARAVTVVNPDGQIASSLGDILTIASLPTTNHPPTLHPIDPMVVTELQLLTFTNSASDPDGNLLSFSLGPGAPSNATVHATSGVFDWIPSEEQGPGTNFINVIVADNGTPSLTATQSFSVAVLETNSAPVLSPIPDRVVHAGTSIQFTNSATDSDLPPNQLAFSLLPGAPPGASLNSSNGLFVWQTGDADAGTSNSITVKVTDNGIPGLEDSQTFTVEVVTRPLIQSIEISNSIVRLTWNAVAGQRYRLQTNTDLTMSGWGDVSDDVIAGGSVAGTNTTVNTEQQYFRVRLLP